jgi:hypothetical protein
MGLGSYKTSLKLLRQRAPAVRKINSRYQMAVMKYDELLQF